MEIRHVLLDHYEYTLMMEGEKYYVLCHDTYATRNIKHPIAVSGQLWFTLQEAQAFIDERITRYEDLKKY